MLLRQIKSGYEDAAESITKEMSALFGRYTDENGLSYVKAMELLDGAEYRTWRMGMKEYLNLIEKFQSTNDSFEAQKLILELNTLIMRKRIQRQEALRGMIRANMANLARVQEQKIGGHLTETFKDGYYRNMHAFYKKGNQKALELCAMHAVKITDEQILNVIKIPWSGSDYSSKIWSREYRIADKLQNLIVHQLLTGKHPRVIARKISDELGKDYKYAAVRLIRTETAFVKGQADLMSWKKIGVKEYEFVATLDGRTSEICKEKDGKKYPIDQAIPGKNYPPMHPNCRSTTIPVTTEQSAKTRLARDKNGKNVKVPADMTYPDWKAALLAGDTGNLTSISQKDTMKLKDDVMKDLVNISEVKSNDDIKNFAEQLIDNLNIDRTNITISVNGIADPGHCVFGQGTTKDVIHYEEYVLDANDKRSMTHRVKTAFHESFHLSAEGMEWDGLDSSGRKKEAWRSLEETFAESSAHYMLERYGVTEKIAPAYPKELVTNLPRLKQLSKYSSCNAIQDFGEIAFADRQNGIGPKWIGLSKQMKKVKLADDYYKQYYTYIKNNEDDLFDMFLENMPGFEQRKSNMKIDLKSAMNKDRIFLNDDEQIVYYGILSCVMQKVGVK